MSWPGWTPGRARLLAASLAEAFATWEDTIRRDLRDLAGRGLCRRVYGGALPVSPASNPPPRGDRSQGGALKGVGGPRPAGLIRLHRRRLDKPRGREGFPDDLRLTVATHDPAIAAALLAKHKV
jgi:hypothetical protein